ncbi:Unknown protein, partial [Striga hermonthica]
LSYSNFLRINGFFNLTHYIYASFRLITDILPQVRSNLCVRVLTQGRFAGHRNSELVGVRRDYVFNRVQHTRHTITKITNNDFFMLFINHKGRFVTLEGHEYYYGDFVATVTGLDADRLGYFNIEDQIKKLGYENWGRICYKHRTTHEFQDIKDDA